MKVSREAHPRLKMEKVKVLRGSRGPYTKHSARTQRRKKQNLLNAAAGFTKIDLSSFDRADAVKKSNPLTVKSNPLTVKPQWQARDVKNSKQWRIFLLANKPNNPNNPNNPNIWLLLVTRLLLSIREQWRNSMTSSMHSLLLFLCFSFKTWIR